MNRPPTANEFRILDYPILMGKVFSTEIPSMKLKINPISFWVKGTTFVEYNGGLSPAFVPHITGTKWGILCLHYEENRRIVEPYIIYGLPSSNDIPPFPKITTADIPLAAVFLEPDTYEITSSMIYDIRSLYSTACEAERAHNSLINRDTEDSHPMSAITGLIVALDEKITETRVKELLTEKADIDGTPSRTFILGKETIGIPTNDIYIMVERGSLENVGIRWSEDRRIWELTNDGLHWYEFSGAIANQSASNTQTGGVRLSVMPIDPEVPIAVGDNDERLFTLTEKGIVLGLSEIIQDIDERLTTIEDDIDGGDF